MSYYNNLVTLANAKSSEFMFWTSVQESNFLHEFLEKVDPKINWAIEIGTCNGLGTLEIADVSVRVNTFDVAYRNAEYLWTLFPGMRCKIDYCCGPQANIDFTIAELKHYYGEHYNFAFIDGDHTYEAAKHDFELVRFCGRVLFHDVHGEGVGQFALKELGAKVVDDRGIYGYWEA
jgi:predicted O-methyltransferase YrrM